MVKKRLLAGVMLAALFLTGCSSAVDGGTGPTDQPTETSTLNVGTIPLSSDVSAYIAQDKGYYAEHDLNVQLNSSAGFAPILASVLNGEQQVGFASIIPVIVAKSKGAPIKILMATDFGHDKADEDLDPAWVFVPADSGIKSALDLQGKTVGVNALGSSQDLNIKIIVKQAGGDPEKVKFLVLPPKDTVASAMSGKIDAVAVSEPFTSQAQDAGMTPLFPYVSRGLPGQVVGVYFTSDATAASRGEQITSFVSAIRKATELAATDPDVVTESLAGYTSVPAEQIAKMRNFVFRNDIRDKDVEVLSELLLDYGFMEKPVSADDILWRE